MPFQGRCKFCREVRLVSLNRKLGEYCCNTCYIRHLQPRWRCAGCGEERRASYVVDAEAGTRLCATCYQSQIHTATCARCGKPDAPIHHRAVHHRPICTECYHLLYQRPRRAGRDGPTEHQRAALVEMQEIASERGGWCLSTRYEDSQTRLRWRCRQNHEWEAIPISVTQGSWCGACAGVVPGTLEQMHALAAERGGQCLSTRYRHGRVKLQWRCAEGHEWAMESERVKAGQWCPDCGGTKRLTIEAMQALAKERGGACLSTAYVRLSEPLRWRCAEGHEWDASASSVKTASAWCPACAGVKKPKLDDLQAHARDRGGACLAEQYRNSTEAVPWRCGEGHTWSAPWSRIHRGAWCPDCARDRRRLPKPRLTLEVMHTYAAKFGGQCLSDRYVNCNTKLTWRCAAGHVFEAVQSSVAAGHWCPDCGGARRGSLADLVAVARARGGDCLSREYLGVSASYRWRCAEGHEWNAVAGNVKHGTWCPVCSGRHALGIDVLDALARERGGVCLSRVYVNSQTHLRWRCAESHEWEAIPASIRRGSWCPVCALDRRVSRTADARRPRA
jgi:hypothetical protein